MRKTSSTRLISYVDSELTLSEHHCFLRLNGKEVMLDATSQLMRRIRADGLCLSILKGRLKAGQLHARLAMHISVITVPIFTRV